MGRILKSKIVKSDSVFVISGDDRGKIGKVLKVIKCDSYGIKVIVSGVNIKSVICKDASGSRLVSKEFPVDVSNVMYFDVSNTVRGRVGFRFVDGKKIRYCKSSDGVIG